MVDFSVIVPTKDRAEILRDCLRSLQSQVSNRIRFEVVVVDNGSVDHTKAVVESFDCTLNIKYVYAAEPGLHVGRHAGSKVATSDILVFIDDDVQVGATWSEGLLESFSDKSVGLVGGNNYPDFKGSVPRWLHERWNTPNEFGKSIGQLSVSDFGQGIYEIDARFIWGCNFAIRRSLLDSAKGFHPDGFPKELLKFRGDGESYVADHVGRSSFRVVFNSKVSVLHLVTPERMTREYFVRREYAQGVSDSYKDIRDASGLSGSFSMLLRRRVRIARAQIRRFSNRLKHELSSEQKEWLDLEREMEKSYWKGYGFHRRSVRSDSGLLDWVLKGSYYD